MRTHTSVDEKTLTGSKADISFSTSLTSVLDSLASALGAKALVLLLYDDIADGLSIVACKGLDSVALLGESIKRSEVPILATAIGSTEQLVREIAPSDLAACPNLAQAFGRSDLVAIPLNNGAPVGIVISPARLVQADKQSVLATARACADLIQRSRPETGQNDMLHRVLDAYPGGVAAVAVSNAVFTYASRSFRQIFGAGATVYVGRPVDQVISEPSAARLLKVIRRAVVNRQTEHDSTFQIDDQFGSRHFELHVVPEIKEKGQCEFVFLTLWPRTDVVMVRQALENSVSQLGDSQRLLSAVLDHTNNGVFLVGTDLSVLYTNKRMGELFGFDTRDIVGKNKLDVVDQRIMDRMADPEKFANRLRYLYEHMETIATDEIDVVRPAPRILDRYSAPVYREDNTLLGRIEVYSDVTDVRNLQRSKDEFLALVSHELRTPVTSIKGYAQLLKRRARAEDLPTRTLMAYATIERQADHMQDLIEALLDVTRLDASRFRLELGEVDLRALIGRSIEMVQIMSDTHEIRANLPPEEATIRADERRLEQVMMNLLTNAVRYSPGGGVITVGLEDDGDRFEISVQDEGIGVAKDAMAHIFERFYRAPGNPQSTGLGIGLYITRGIVEHHGGSISVRSSPGEGSRFTVVLPRSLPK